jgi:hypothetical protein
MVKAAEAAKRALGPSIAAKECNEKLWTIWESWSETDSRKRRPRYIQNLPAYKLTPKPRTPVYLAECRAMKCVRRKAALKAA